MSILSLNSYQVLRSQGAFHTIEYTNHSNKLHLESIRKNDKTNVVVIAAVSKIDDMEKLGFLSLDTHTTPLH